MKKINFLFLISVYFLLITGCTKQDEKPNILLILVDDMGFSDLGSYGSEISTPNIDKLAFNGLRFTNFYNSARCCPTRASLLTGLYPHEAGMGKMVATNYEAETKQGPYQGYLNNNCVTLAEVLKTAGYKTVMSGKWHVGEEHPQWPMDRGFDDYYGLISGAADYFNIRKTKYPGVIRHFAKGNQEFMPDTVNFYMTNAITENAVRMLDENKKGQQPLFMYLAYTAPHWPLHALPEDIEKYRGKYLKGWDKLREERYQRQQQMNLFDADYGLSPRDSVAPAWDSLSPEKQKEMDLKMAVYAAQIECMDRGVGQVVEKLEQQGRLQNTLILFLSDNGGCAEGGPLGEDFWKNGAPAGGRDSYQNYGLAWANASNTPFRKFKQYIHEGGISTPLIVHWPKGLKAKGEITHQSGHIIDIMATLCDISGAAYPVSYNEHNIKATEGKSLMPIFKGEQRPPHETLCWEHFGSAGILKGDWKLVALNGHPWELYNIKEDRTELNNLIKDSPDKAKELLQDWLVWAKRCEVEVSTNLSQL
jgi:arylsulfatase A-like enzyme